MTSVPTQWERIARRQTQEPRREFRLPKAQMKPLGLRCAKCHGLLRRVSSERWGSFWRCTGCGYETTGVKA